MSGTIFEENPGGVRLASKTQYDEAFYAAQRGRSLRSARIVVPLLLSKISVHSVADVGCGVGTWLKAFQENGVSDAIGYDGSYVEQSALEIDQANFEAVDLSTEYVLPRTFDLAISLEVGEHLTPKAGENLVQQLVSIAPLVMFSAAIPGQGGTNHINEQWQDHWRSKFRAFGYQPADAIRPFIWGDADVNLCYQQNTILYYREGHLPPGAGMNPIPEKLSLNMVHPDLYIESQIYFSKALKSLPSLAAKAFAKRFSNP